MSVYAFFLKNKYEVLFFYFYIKLDNFNYAIKL